MHKSLNNIENEEKPVDSQTLAEITFIGKQYFFIDKEIDRTTDLSKKFCETINCHKIAFKFTNIKSISYIKNADKRFTYICSIDRENKPVYDIIELKEMIDDELHEKLITNDLCRSITFEINFLGNMQIELVGLINKISNEWSLIRALGINIPLLLVQVLLGRQIITYPMVDQDNLFLKDGEIIYDLRSKDCYWFDLDETLIFKDKAIHTTLNLVKHLNQIRKSVNLITRNNGAIVNLLNDADIDHTLFQKKIYVPPSLKKSLYVSNRDVFIDNEFPQRYDVRKVTNAFTMDLDQIDYVSSEYL